MAQVCDCPSRIVLHQIWHRRGTGRYRKTFGTDGFGAGNIQRRIANHDDLIPRQLALEQTRRSLLGDTRYLVAIMTIIPEPSGIELTPKIKASKFQLRPQANIARKQTEGGRLRKALKIAEKLRRGWACSPRIVFQDVVQPKIIGIEEVIDMHWRVLNVMPPEELLHKPSIRAPCELHALSAVGNAEGGFKRVSKGFASRSTRVQQGAINIKQNETYHGVSIKVNRHLSCAGRYRPRENGSNA